MKDIFVHSNYEKVYESNNEYAYIIGSNDKFIKMICNMYNIKLCLCIQRGCTNIKYICFYRYENYVKKVLPLPKSFFFRVVSFKKDSTNQIIPMNSNVLIKYDSFQMNLDECIKFLKNKMIIALGCGFNKLTEYDRNEDFGTIPRGSSENEIMMKMELMGCNI